MTPCKIDGCINEAGLKGTAKGLCRSHYKRYLRYGDPTVDLKRIPNYHGDKCLQDGCSLTPVSNGLCENHYVMERRRKDPIGNKRRSEAYRQRLLLKREIEAGRKRSTNCDLCFEPCSTVWDHDHITGKFRGWLCDRCNRVLGSIKDSTDLLFKMIEYLENTNVKANHTTEKEFT